MTEQRAQRQLSAILAADIAGYSRLIGLDEEGTLARLKELRRSLIDLKINEHRGRIVKTMGDGLLVQFASAVDAVLCAAEIQRLMTEQQTGTADERWIRFRMGINVGDIVIDGDDIQGDGVNIAARLETISQPGGICISGSVHDQVRDKLDFAFEYLGEQQLKNIARPVRVFSASMISKQIDVALAPNESPSVAVLPFTNMSSDPEQEFFADGLTEDLITAVSKVPGLFVIARHSTFAYKGKPIDVRQAARELGVNHIIEGSVRRVGKRVRVTVQLLEAQGGRHLWGERFDRDLEDIFAVQDEVVANIVKSLPTALPASTTKRKRHVPDIEVYDLFVRGRALTVDTRAKTTLAYPLLERAIDLDPDFSDAHAWLAMNLVFQFIDKGGDETEKILAAANRAVTLDPENADARFALGYVLTYSGDLRGGRQQFELALSANPNHADAWLYLADLEVFEGHAEAAVQAVERALRLNPYPHATYYWMAGFALYAAKRYDEAVKQLEHPSCRGTGAQRIRAAALAQLGQLDEAREVGREFMTTYPSFTIDSWAKIQPFRNGGDLHHFVEGYAKAGLPK